MNVCSVYIFTIHIHDLDLRDLTVPGLPPGRRHSWAGRDRTKHNHLTPDGNPVFTVVGAVTPPTPNEMTLTVDR